MKQHTAGLKRPHRFREWISPVREQRIAGHEAPPGGDIGRFGHLTRHNVCSPPAQKTGDTGTTRRGRKNRSSWIR